MLEDNRTRWSRVVAASAVLLVLAPNGLRAATAGAADSASLVSPVSRSCVSSPFGPRILSNRPLAGSFHGGIDLAAAVGSPVIAVASGTVIRIHRRGVGGLEMLIQHDGFIGVYSHLGLITPTLAEGRKAVYGGEKIATIGRSGLTYGPHLYFGMIINGRPVDPAPYVHVARCESNSRGVGVASTRPVGKD
jgi:murein DD-endopeptidase MepM/ murein hydrolase activator NlpD